MIECKTCGELLVKEKFRVECNGKRRGSCFKCESAKAQARQRTPKGWADMFCNVKRDRTRAERAGIPFRKLPADQLLDKALATTGHCDVTGRFCGLPWNHVGDKHAGLVIDHILSIPVCKASGIEWNTIDNIQFIYKGVHSKKSADETRARAVIMQSLPYYTVPERASVEWSI